jgi:hypothetical protein
MGSHFRITNAYADSMGNEKGAKTYMAEENL